MKKDERIQTTINRFAARGFVIWYVLMMISLYYRMLILKQNVLEFWDIGAIFFIGTLYVSIAGAKKGVIDPDLFKWKSWTIGIPVAAIIGFFTFQSITGRMPSVVEVGTFLIVFFPRWDWSSEYSTS